MSLKKFYFFSCLCMQKMSCDTKRLTKERKITAQIYSKNKTHTICVHKKLTDEDFAIQVKMIDLQNYLHHRNLCYVAMKTTESYFVTKNPTTEQVKKDMYIKNGSMD